MNISQCLRRIAALKGELAETLAVAARSVSFKDESPPAFSFSAQLEKASGLRTLLINMETALAITNATTTITVDGETYSLTRATRELKELKGHIAWVKALVVAAHEKTVSTEIDYNADKTQRISVAHTCHLPEVKRAELTSSLQKRFASINDAVESANHRVDIDEKLVSKKS